MEGAFFKNRMVLPIVLLVMILMRLVWMQLRSYPVELEGRALYSLGALADWADFSCVYDPAASKSAAIRMLKEADELRVWFLSPGYAALAYSGCLVGILEDQPIVHLNQLLLAVTILLSVMMTRFIASSWTVALIVGAMLLSRGTLLAGIGEASLEIPGAFVIMAWLTGQTHFLRTGSKVTLAATALVTVFGTMVDPSFLLLSLPMPLVLCLGYAYRRRLARPVLERFRWARRRFDQWTRMQQAPAEFEVKTTIGRMARGARWLLGTEFPKEAHFSMPRPEDKGGGLFGVLGTPYLLWVYAKGRWIRVAVFWGFVLLLSLSSFAIYLRWVGGPHAVSQVFQLQLSGWGALTTVVDDWWSEIFGRYDIHLAVSIFVLLLSAVQSPADGLVGFLETTWVSVLAILLVGFGALYLNGVDQVAYGRLAADGIGAPLAPRAVGFWFEPLLLSLGASGVHNLLKVLDTRIAKRG